jgi:Fic family protein
MRVISGSMGKEKVHFQAPPAKNLPKELESFFYWFNNPKENANWLLRSAIAHLWFVTLHPFEDGNGRIARTLSEMFLVRSDHSTNRYYSMSGQIYKRRREYYQILEKTQKGDLDCTAWMIWYLDCLEKSLDVSLEEVEKSCKRKIIWDYVNQQHIHPRKKTITPLSFPSHPFDPLSTLLPSPSELSVVQILPSIPSIPADSPQDPIPHFRNNRRR